MPLTYEPIATQTVGSSVASITFSSIPSTYTDLVLVCSGGHVSAGDTMFLRFNSDSGSNYSFTELWGNGSTPSSSRGSNQSSAFLSNNLGGGTSAGQSYIANIMNYSNTTTNKTMITRANQPDNTYPGVSAIISMWRNTAAINTISVGRTGAGDLLAGSVITIYGIKAA
jgi:hypothetical protein